MEFRDRITGYVQRFCRKEQVEGDIFSDGFTRSEALTYNKKSPVFLQGFPIYRMIQT